MEQRSIGGFKVPVLGLGTSRLASLGAGGSLRGAARVLDTAADLGVSFIDTADTYGSTQCERWLGELMQKCRQPFVVATKCGLPTVDLPWPLRALNQPAKKLLRLACPAHRVDPAYVRRSIDSSLRRLRRERIEFYFIHEPPTGVEQMDDLFSVLDAARAAGKIGVHGVCSENTEIIRAAVHSNRCEIVQTAGSPRVTHTLLSALDSVGQSHIIEVIANHVLGADVRPPAAAAAKTCSSPVLLSKKLDELSAERGVSRAHLLIRHAAAVPNVRVVLTATSNPVHLAENVNALAVPVTAEDLLA